MKKLGLIMLFLGLAMFSVIYAFEMKGFHPNIMIVGLVALVPIVIGLYLINSAKDIEIAQWFVYRAKTAYDLYIGHIDDKLLPLGQDESTGNTVYAEEFPTDLIEVVSWHFSYMDAKRTMESMS